MEAFEAALEITSVSMAIKHCGDTTAFWVCFHRKGCWRNLFFLNSPSPHRPVMEMVFQVPCPLSLLLPALPPSRPCQSSTVCRQGPQFGTAMLFLPQERQGPGLTLDSIPWKIQTRLCWRRQASQEGTRLWRSTYPKTPGHPPHTQPRH